MPEERGETQVLMYCTTSLRRGGKHKATAKLCVRTYPRVHLRRCRLRLHRIPHSTHGIDKSKTMAPLLKPIRGKYIIILHSNLLQDRYLRHGIFGTESLSAFVLDCTKHWQASKAQISNGSNTPVLIHSFMRQKDDRSPYIASCRRSVGT